MNVRSDLSSSEQFLRSPNPGPLIRSLPLPVDDPFELYARLTGFSKHSFLLESGKGSAEVSRYSFIGSDPFLVFSSKGANYTIRTSEQTIHLSGDPFKALRDLLPQKGITRDPALPPFLGGAVGFLSYDFVRQLESLPQLAADDLQMPDLFFLFVEILAAIDHETKILHLMFAPHPQRMEIQSRDHLYREGEDRLAEMRARLVVPSRWGNDQFPQFRRASIHGQQSRSAYVRRVRECQDFIAAGDIYQANLSHRFTVEWPKETSEGSGIQGAYCYQQIRRINPSPFSAFLLLDDWTVVCNSPERLVRLQGKLADSRPIAGTRPRGKNLAEDRRFVESLLTSNKEKAEHLMLVDLVRNDLGRVSRYGSVNVEEFMTVERYSHVAHLVSEVSGFLRDGLSGCDLIPAMFPGGTITGVPKYHCMEIIERLEPVRRGLYTGSIGYFSWTGEMDMNIVIRTLLLTKGQGYLQVGAGIVADSDPHLEYEETVHKAKAFFQAV
ncbi:MAG: anthranilate synthase component I family protein [Nitrospirota bacterium]|nr:MAG: anthranilate synthase component I family protein [Nitrospirota bacterium]